MSLSVTSRIPVSALAYSEFDRFFRERKAAVHQRDSAVAFLYRHGVSSFGEITTLPKNLRRELENEFVLHPASVQTTLGRDGTVKYLFNWEEAFAEAVLIPAVNGRTLCLSVQAGCRFRCAFCATGTLGLKRSLTFGQILEQVLTASGDDAIARIVVMGMGEPLDNLPELIPALRFLRWKNGWGFSRKRITVSTVGLPDKIGELSAAGVRTNLAVSLHAPNDSLRSRLVPANRRFPIRELLEEARDYGEKARARVTLEYVLLDEVNDSPAEARELARLSRRYRMPINVIEFNPIPELPFTPSRRLESFVAILAEKAFGVTVRRSRGRDIQAACGQLAARGSA